MTDDCALPPAVECGSPPHASAAPATNRPAGDGLKAALESVQSELIASQRLALLGNLTAMVAHEFNNLMTPVVARAEAALQSDDVAFMRKALDRTLVQTQRAIAVSKHLLDLAHGAAVAPETCSVADAVREAIAMMARPFEKDGIELRVAVPADLRVAVRGELFGQVLLNLLLNARQAMKGLSGPLSLTAVADGDHVVIDVRDSGRGIAADTLERVLNPFLAADPLARPTDWRQVGLGLSVCRLIAHRHGATIRAFASAERGCTFRLRWPRADSASAS